MNQSLSPSDRYLQALAPGSRRTMTQAVGVLEGLLTGDEKAGPDWAELGREDVLTLRRQLAERYAPSTANKMLAAFRGVMRACRDAGNISERQFQELTGFDRVPDAPPVESRVLSNTELDHLFAACDADGTAAGRRDAALLTVYLEAGLRREEATALAAASADLEAGELMIDSPINERRRRVPLTEGGRARLEHWLEARGEGSGPLLCPVDKGGTIRPRKMSAQSVYAAVARVGAAAGVDSVTPRDLRRTCLVQLIRVGLDADALRQRVGHLSWLTTAAYAQLAAEAAGRKPWQIPPPREGER